MMTPAESRQQFVGNRLMSAGYHPFGAFAIVGNGCGESGPSLNSTFERAHADHGSGGFLEWRDSQGAPRKTKLATFADAHQTDRNDLAIQVDYAIWELGKDFPELDAQLRHPGTRTIDNLTANFCDMFENPAPATAGLDNRIAHAKAAYATWRAIQEATAPAPASIPQVPVPQAPIPAPPPYTVPNIQSMPTSAGLPPISPTSAGRIASGTDTLVAMREARVAELVSADPEIAAYDAALAAFGKLVAHPAIPALQKPAAEPAVITPQINQRMKMDPQVSATLRSILLALGGAAVSKGLIDQSTLVSVVGIAVTVASYGWSLWGHSKTSIIASAAALPEVQKIVTTAAIADSPKFVANPTVVSH